MDRPSREVWFDGRTSWRIDSIGRWLASLLAVTALIAALATAAGAAAPRDPRQEHTPAGMTQASKALLTYVELGRGWMSGRAKNVGHILAACTGALKPDESDLVETGIAAEFSELGIKYLLQTASVYKTPSDAQRAWARTLAASPVKCMERTLRKNAEIRPVSHSRLRLPTVAAGVVGYRVYGRSRSHGQVLKTYYDQILIRSGTTVTRLFLTSFARPFSATFEDLVVRDIAERLAGQPINKPPTA